MTTPTMDRTLAAAAAATAERFVAARRNAIALAEFPGRIPATLADAYRTQELAIRLWGDAIVGWKVGYIAPEQRELGGDERLVGPIFAHQARIAQIDQIVDFPVFVGGFAAVEAELVFRLGADAPADQFDWLPQQAAAIVADVHIGIETAGSPLAIINDLGPTVIVSDFGNNAGLLLGPKIPGWQALRAPAFNCACYVEGKKAGEGEVQTLADGPLVALAFALSRCARNKRPLRKGDLVTTGAITGVHSIAAGESARVDFGSYGNLLCRAVASQS